MKRVKFIMATFILILGVSAGSMYAAETSGSGLTTTSTEADNGEDRN